MSWSEYVARHARGRTQRDLAAMVGVSPTAISRWISGEQGADAGSVIRFARVVGDSPTAVLIIAGFLTEEEAKARPRLAPDPDQLSDDDLLRILRERLNRGGEERERSAPTSPVRTLTPRPTAEEVSDLDDEVAPAAKHGVIEESGEFNT